MRYPVIAVFFFVFVLPPFTAHALLAGKATFVNRVGQGVQHAVVQNVPVPRAQLPRIKTSSAEEKTPKEHSHSWRIRTP